MKPTLGFLAAAATAGAMAFSAPAMATTNPDDLSPANQEIFTKDHMASVTEPVKIIYDFKKGGSQGKGFTDTVEEKVSNIRKSGRKDINFHFLSGDHYMDLPFYQNVRGNPIPIAFLEWDVREMQQLTGGSAFFFRRQILNALAGSATVKTVTFTMDGQSHEGTEVSVRPYTHGDMVDRYPRYQFKEYTFIFSKDLPGGVYRISAVTPGVTLNKPLTDESLTFHGTETLGVKRTSIDDTTSTDVAEKTSGNPAAK